MAIGDTNLTNLVLSGYLTTGGVINQGSSSSKISLGTAGTPASSLYTTSALTTGVVNAAIFNHTVTGAGASGELVEVAVTSAVQTGSYLNAIVGRVTYTAPGQANGGMVAPICGELNLPGAAQSGGVYTVFDAELNCPASWTAAGNAALPVSFLRFGLWGNSTAVGSFKDNGYLFHIDGVGSAAAGDIFDTCTAAAASHALRINIGGTAYYIMLNSNVDA